MKIKTSEMTGIALRWAVAKCEGRVLHMPNRAANENDCTHCDDCFGEL